MINDDDSAIEARNGINNRVASLQTLKLLNEMYSPRETSQSSPLWVIAN